MSMTARMFTAGFCSRSDKLLSRKGVIASKLFELARVLVRVDHVASMIVNANFREKQIHFCV
jgi:hypothetical protein